MNLTERLHKRETLGNLRRLQLIDGLIDFASNDYLGLARSDKLTIASLRERQSLTIPLNGFGSTGSRLLTGNSLYAQHLENTIANFHGFPEGLLFSCGYMANVGLISAIANPSDTIIFDSHIHASIHDGIRLSRACALPFKHNQPEHLEHRLKAPCKGNRFICVESVYSTDGAIAPLQEICRLAHKYNAYVIVDEAHAIGIFGPQGRGLIAEYNLTDQVFAQVITFGKALGTYGAIILGDYTLKQLLLNFANSVIYTTALPMQALISIKCSYDIFPTLEIERHQLRKLPAHFHKAGFNKSASHIHPILIQGNEAVHLAALRLQQAGFDVRPLKSPTVKRRQESLRICLHAFNTENEVLSLLEKLCSII